MDDQSDLLTQEARKFLLTEFIDPITGRRITHAQKMVREVGLRALDGDRDAVKLFWSYMEGMPKQKVEVAAVQAEPVDIDEETLAMKKEYEQKLRDKIKRKALPTGSNIAS